MPPRVGPVAVVLFDKVDGESYQRDGRVVGHRLQALCKQRARVGAATPQIERISSVETVVQQCVDAPQCGRTQRRERHAEFVRAIGHHRAFGARVVHGSDPDPRRGRRPTASSSSVSVNSARSRTTSAPVPSASASQVACAPANAPECAVTRLAPSGELPTGSTTVGTFAAAARRSALDEPGTVARGLEDEREHPRVRVLEHVVEVVGGRRHEFLPGRDREGVTERAAGTQQRREDRSRVRDQRDRPAWQHFTFDVAGRAQAVVDD